MLARCTGRSTDALLRSHLLADESVVSGEGVDVGARHLPGVVDPRHQSLSSTRDVDGAESSACEQESVHWPTRYFDVVTRDVARAVDTPCSCQAGEREVDRGEAAGIQREPVGGIRVEVIADDVAARVDPGDGGAGGSGKSIAVKVPPP